MAENSKLQGGIGILGGTFDPIHLGHIAVAKKVIEHYSLSRVYVVPTYKNPLRYHEQPVGEADDRFVMAHLATLDEPQLIVTGVEIERGREMPEPSYTIYTVERYRARYPGRPLVLIVGADNAAFHKWHRISEYPDLITRIAVVSRPEYETTVKRDLDKVHIEVKGLADLIDLLPILDIPLSGTGIRKSLALNIVPPNSLHPDVERYIRKYGLYGLDR